MLHLPKQEVQVFVEPGNNATRMLRAAYIIHLPAVDPPWAAASWADIDAVAVEHSDVLEADVRAAVVYAHPLSELIDM